jgi:hypothetical protein
LSAQEIAQRTIACGLRLLDGKPHTSTMSIPSGSANSVGLEIKNCHRQAPSTGGIASTRIVCVFPEPASLVTRTLKLSY